MTGLYIFLAVVALAFFAVPLAYAREVLTQSRVQLVLSILQPGAEMLGLDIARRSNGLLKPDTVYVLLARMEREGLVVSQLELIHPVRAAMGQLPRRLYRRAS